jgi:hypothetical protein
VDVIDQTQIDDIDGYLWVVTLAEGSIQLLRVDGGFADYLKALRLL